MINTKSLLIAAVTALTLPALTACSSSPDRQSFGSYVDDTTITTRVKTALLGDPDVSGTQVQVETYKGVVQLSGFVDSEADARRAAELARKVNGVQSVKNDLRIKPTGR